MHEEQVGGGAPGLATGKRENRCGPAKASGSRHARANMPSVIFASSRDIIEPMHIDPWILAFSAITVIATIWMGFWSAKKSKTAQRLLRRRTQRERRLERQRHLRRIPQRRQLHGRGGHGDESAATTRCGIRSVTRAAICSCCCSSPGRCGGSGLTRFPISPKAASTRRSSARSPSCSCCSSGSSTRCRR